MYRQGFLGHKHLQTPVLSTQCFIECFQPNYHKKKLDNSFVDDCQQIVILYLPNLHISSSKSRIQRKTYVLKKLVYHVNKVVFK